MTTQQIADRFNELAQKGEWNKVYEELYSPDAESIEPANALGLGSAKGMPEILKKGKAWEATIEAIHSAYTGAPQVAGNYFVCTMGFDGTFKGAGRKQIDEVALYEVRNGKIVKEQFFY
ncbi:MAG TPA: nuclear transport factor 2 family protein [Cyclobacteriaceae bacterium]|nr:nuclear transport factor 2 family protein [Cyclobacteriaceae bacterium]